MNRHLLLFFFVFSVSVTFAQEHSENGADARQTSSVDVSQASNDLHDDKGTYHLTPRQPEFPFGQDSLRNYVASRLDKKLIKKVGKSGLVYASFEVALDSTVQNVKIVMSLDPKVDQAVVEALLASPKWYPAVCCSPSYVKYDPKSDEPKPCEYCVVRVRYPFQITLDED